MKIKYISWLPAALLMLVIFIFSSKPADTSNDSSLNIANRILTIYEDTTNQQYQEPYRFNLLETINHFVRKMAHFCEYAVLSIAFALHFLINKKSGRYRIIWSTLLSACYAATDEYHQTFVPGRSGQLSDVLLDTMGALVGVVCFTLLLGLIKSCSNRNKAKMSR